MTLQLYYHPFSNFCQKVLIALDEKNVQFERKLIDLGDPESRAELLKVWPIGKFPVLRDDTIDLNMPESTIIVGYLDRRFRAGAALMPSDPTDLLRVRLFDRVIDNYVMVPTAKIVTDRFRPAKSSDKIGVQDAKALIAAAYDVIENALPDQGWAVGSGFTLADCAAAPDLFYANLLVPFGARPRLNGYFERLLGRPSVRRAIDEARPYRSGFPFEWPEGYGD